MHAPYAKTALIAISLLTKAFAQGSTVPDKAVEQAPGGAAQVTRAPLPGETYARDLEVLNKRDRAYAEEIRARLGELGSDLQLVAVIPRLDNRYGCFADVDGDGDLDYLSTEVTQGKEEVRLHRNSDTGWRNGGSRSQEIDKKRPLVPWFLDNDGTGKRVMVVPLAVAPYLMLFRLNPRGDFTGRAESLQEYLPRRLSRPQGLDNNPYTIEKCEGATEFRDARIVGRMTDENDRSRQDVRFELTLRKDGSIGVSIKQVAPGPKVERAYKRITPVESAAGCKHQSGERDAIVATHMTDVNGDGIDDLVMFSGVLSAHVFPGVLKAGSKAFEKSLGFGAQAGTPRALPIEDLRIWFPVPLLAGPKERPYAYEARAQLARIGFRIDSDKRHDAAFTIRTGLGRGWFLNYYATGEGLVPVQDYRSSWPHKTGHHPMVERYRDSVVLDADHDRTPDLLSVHVGQQFEWLRPQPKERAVRPSKHRRDVEPGRLRCGIVHGLGERHDEVNGVLVQFDEEVRLSKNPNDEYPVRVTRVPVYEGDVTRWRYCVLFRPRSIGYIFEVASVAPDVRQQRRYEAWLRRGERRLEMQPFYRACDQGECKTDEPVAQEVFVDAIALFKKALPLARDARAKGMVWRHIARCHGRSGDLDAARRAYERFVMTAKVVEKLAAPDPDLRALFADESFRALHRGWCRKWPQVDTASL